MYSIYKVPRKKWLAGSLLNAKADNVKKKVDVLMEQALMDGAIFLVRVSSTSW